MDSNLDDFQDSVLGVLLAGFSTASSAVVTAADTVLVALGKLQAQITALVSPAMAPVVSATTTPAAVAALMSPGQNVNVYAESGDTGHKADWVWNDTNAGQHMSNDNSAVAISYRTVGSGVNGPAAADFGMTVSVVKRDWTTSATLGEIDGLSIAVRQGCDDCSGISANVGCIRGFATGMETTVYQFAPTTGAVINGVDIQLGAIETGLTGTAYLGGLVVTAMEGAFNDGLLIQSEGAASFSIFLNCVDNTGTVKCQILSDGAVSSLSHFDGTGVQVSGIPVVGARQTGWTAGTGAMPNKGAFNYRTATLAQLAARMMALEQALFAATGHGLIGP